MHSGSQTGSQIESKNQMSLTIKGIAKLTKPGRYHDSHGLILQVGKTGAKSWLLRYQRNGRERRLGLGPLHVVPLKQARLRAQAARLQLLDGIDPIDARHAERARQAAEAAKVVTFATCALQYHAAHGDKWVRRHRDQFLKTLKDYAFPALGSLPVASIDVPLVLAVLRPIWQSKTSTASRVRRRIEAVLDYAAASGLRQGDNPARWEVLKTLLPAPGKIAPVKHHGALPYAETPAFIAEVRKLDSIPARALEFAILTAARTSEVLGMTWNEIDIAARRWTIPAGRMKARRDHMVPLSPRAIEILSALPREGDFVFIGPRPGQPIGPAAMRRRTIRQPGVTVHGFRSTFSDWAHETTAFPSIVIEQALSHSVGNAVERAYRRGDLLEKRRKLMNAWAEFCNTPASARGAVTPIRQRAGRGAATGH